MRERRERRGAKSRVFEQLTNGGEKAEKEES